VAARPEILDNLPDGRSHADGLEFLATEYFQSTIPL